MALLLPSEREKVTISKLHVVNSDCKGINFYGKKEELFVK